MTHKIKILISTILVLALIILSYKTFYKDILIYTSQIVNLIEKDKNLILNNYNLSLYEISKDKHTITYHYVIDPKVAFNKSYNDLFIDKKASQEDLKNMKKFISTALIYGPIESCKDKSKIYLLENGIKIYQQYNIGSKERRYEALKTELSKYTCDLLIENERKYKESLIKK